MRYLSLNSNPGKPALKQLITNKSREAVHELKTSTRKDTRELMGKTVTIFLEPHFVTLTGRWYWDFVSDAVFCSNVMFFLRDVEATKAIIHPDDVEKVRRQLEDDDIRHLEFRLITTYGEVKAITGDMLSVESRPNPLDEAAIEKDEFNKKLTSQKLEQLIILKEVYKKTSRFTGGGIWWYNEATNETWYSPEVFRIHGLAPSSLNAHLNTFLHLVHPEDRDVVEEYTVRSFKERTPLHIEYRIQTVVGERYIQHISQWMFSAKGESVLSGMIKDITEEKKKEREIEELEHRSNFLRQQLLFDEQHRNIAHWSINLITRKFDCSGNYARLFGIKEKVLTDFSALGDFIHPDDRTAFNIATKTMLQQHTAPEIDFRVYRSDTKLRYLSQKAKLVNEGYDLMMIGTLEDVTAKVLSQNKMKELTEAETVRSFAQQHSEEMTGSARWVWNITDNSIQWSEGFYSLLGIKTNLREITHKFFLSMVHPEDRELIMNQINLLLQQKQESSFNLRLQLFRTTKYLTASFRLMKHDEQDLFIAVFRDITKEHLLEETLNEKVKLAESVSENILDRIIITDTYNTIKVWNKACEEAYKMEENGVIGRNFFDVFPQLKTEEEVVLFNRALKGEKFCLKGNRSVASHGFYDLHLLPIWNREHTEVNGIIHIIHDVTQELELQGSLAERFSFIQSLVESSPDHIIALDRNMNYLVWNKRAEEYYGFKKEEVIGKNVLEFFPMVLDTPVYDQLRRVLRGETVHLPGAYGESMYDVYLIPVKNEKDDISAILWMEHDLSREMESEQQLIKQAQLLEAVFNASTSGIIVFKAVRDHENNIVDYEVLMDNAVTQRWNGNSLKGVRYVQMFPSVKQTGLFDAYNKVVETGEVLDTEIFYEGQGFKNWYRVTAVRLNKDQLLATAEDITARKKTEEELIESRRWLEQTAKASPDSIIVYDLLKKQPVYLNDRLAQWVGMSNDDLVQMGVEGRMRLIDPDDRLKLLKFNERVATTIENEVTTFEYRITTSAGKTLWLLNRSKPFQRDGEGKVTHLLSILQNITSEVELQQELKKHSRLAETILDNSTNRVTVFDRNYRFLVWNKRCEQIHGRRKEEVVGKTIFEMFPGIEKSPVFMEAQERSIKGEYVHVPVVEDGYTGAYLELFYVPLKNETGDTYAVLNIMHDVTNYVKNAETMAILNKQLETKNLQLEQKNEEITSFAFVASHDMKEPLRKIQTFSDWLIHEEEHNLSPKGKNMIEKINASVHRMEILIDDILVLTKIHSDTHKEEQVSLDDVLKSVVNDMSELILSTQTVIHKGWLPVIKGNRNQLYYLFKNLVNNAIKFQKPGNIPEVTIASETVKGEEVNLQGTKEDYVKISFTDNGFGFEQRYAKKIFEVFQRLHGKGEFEGTGIGLAICKKIMENHGGIITVQSEQGRGSVFTCFFPLH